MTTYTIIHLRQVEAETREQAVEDDELLAQDSTLFAIEAPLHILLQMINQPVMAVEALVKEMI
jgi:hypothetical protein